MVPCAPPECYDSRSHDETAHQEVNNEVPEDQLRKLGPDQLVFLKGRHFDAKGGLIVLKYGADTFLHGGKLIFPL